MSDFDTGWKCPRCGHLNSDNSKYCRNCSEPWPLAEIICPKCRAVVKLADKHCWGCNTDFTDIILHEWLLEYDDELIHLNEMYATKGFFRLIMIVPLVIFFFGLQFTIEHDFAVLGCICLIGFVGGIVSFVLLSVHRSILKKRIEQLLDGKYQQRFGN